MITIFDITIIFIYIINVLHIVKLKYIKDIPTDYFIFALLCLYLSEKYIIKQKEFAASDATVHSDGSTVAIDKEAFENLNLLVRSMFAGDTVDIYSNVIVHGNLEVKKTNENTLGNLEVAGTCDVDGQSRFINKLEVMNSIDIIIPCHLRNNLTVNNITVQKDTEIDGTLRVSNIRRINSDLFIDNIVRIGYQLLVGYRSDHTWQGGLQIANHDASNRPNHNATRPGWPWNAMRKYL